MRRIAFLLALVLTLPAMADTITIDQYIASLERIRSLLDTNQTEAARGEAKALAAHQVQWSHGTFSADTTLLENPSRERLTATIDELRRAAPAGVAPDPKLLARVAEEQHVPDLVAGGDVPPLIRETPLFERIVESMGNAFRWLGKQLRRFFEWLFDLFPRAGTRDKATRGMNWIVMALVIATLIILLVLAFEVIRRSRRRTKRVVQTSAPLGSKRDEDPLSRGATEWERYAAQLEAAGRYREAIRAWFHAALVNCFSYGVLHYRKSRTNWEYVAALPPSLEWRADFMQLTRLFEREWYGAEQSDEEALENARRLSQMVIENARDAQRGAA